MTPEERFDQNKSLVYWVYNKDFHRFPSYKEEFIQEGFFALWKACLSFNAVIGVQFSTYAVNGIKRHMQNFENRYILKHISTLSLDSMLMEDTPFNLLDVLYQEEDLSVKYAIERVLLKIPNKAHIIRKLMEGYTQNEVAEMFGISQSQVHRALQKFKKIFLEEKNEVH